AVREIGRVLGPGGRLCLAIVHPVNSAGAFQGPDPDAEFVISGDYFAERRYRDVVQRSDLGMTFESRHRPLQDYFAALEATGLLTEVLREPRPLSGSQWDRLPLFIDLRAVRP